MGIQKTAQNKQAWSHWKDPRPLNTEWSYLNIPYNSERLNLQDHQHFPKRGHTSTFQAQLSHTLSDELSPNGHEGQLPNLQHQIVLTTKRCLSNHV